MAIALVGTPTTTTQAATTSIVVNYPAGHASGHVAVVFLQGANNAVTGTKTWTTQITSLTQGGFFGKVLTRVLDGTEGSSETFSQSGNIQMGEMRVYSGVDNVTPMDVAPVAPVGGGGANPSSTGVTTVTDNAEILFFACLASVSTTLSTPTNFGNA